MSLNTPNNKQLQKNLVYLIKKYFSLMEHKQFRQQNFERKYKVNRAEKTLALSQIDLGLICKDDLIMDYLEANDKIMQLEQEDRAKLKKEKIDPFKMVVLDQFKLHINEIKNRRKHEYAGYYKNKYVQKQQRKLYNFLYYFSLYQFYFFQCKGLLKFNIIKEQILKQQQYSYLKQQHIFFIQKIQNLQDIQFIKQIYLLLLSI
ncbi:hypothetical protein pb186bvf_003794 [Paramecium bursaria]